MRQWLGLLRSVVVPTLIFVFPPIVLRSYSIWAFFLTPLEIASELSIRLLGVVLAESMVVIGLGGALKLIGMICEASSQRYMLCRGLLTLTIINSSVGWTLLSSGNEIPGGIKLAVVLAALVVEALVFSKFGWARLFLLFDRMNSDAEPVLLFVPILILAIFLGGFSWRSYDRMPLGETAHKIGNSEPSIVLITMDAFAGEDASLLGYHLPTTPNLERLARRSYNFTHFSSTSSFTTSAAASLLTGLYPFSTHVYQVKGRLSSSFRNKNLPSLLRQHGYATAAIVTNPYAHPLHLSIDDSFDYLPSPPMTPWFEPSSWSLQLRHSLLFDLLLDSPDQLVDYYSTIVPPNPAGLTYFPARSLNEQPDADPRATFGSAERFIDGCPTPFFLWIHTFPPHLPYIVDAKFYQRFLKTTEFTTRADFTPLPSYSNFPPSLQPTLDKVRLRYDEYVAEVDSELGSFLDWLSRSPIGSNVVLIVTADHGESFRHYFGHKSEDLHYSELHIPLLISLAGQSTASLRSEDEDLADVAPTILQLAGIKVPDWMEGHSLAPLSQTPPGEHASFAAWLLKSSIFTRTPSTGSVAVTEADYKLVWYFPGKGRSTLYNINDDPDETKDLSAVLPDKVAQLRAKIRRRFGSQLP